MITALAMQVYTVETRVWIPKNPCKWKTDPGDPGADWVRLGISVGSGFD